MPASRSGGDDDAFSAWILAHNCLGLERNNGRAEEPVSSLGNRLLPRGLAHQHRYARQMLRQFDGDIPRLLATAHTCRANARDDTRTATRRLADLRAADLCEQAAALVTGPAGEDPGRRAALARRLINGDDLPKREPRYHVVWTVRLPVPAPFRTTCMPHLTAGQRLVRQLRPRRDPRDCCWYHAGDWLQASATAIRLLKNARRAGASGDDVSDHAAAAAETERMSEWQFEAVTSLLNPAIAIQADLLAGTGEPLFVNGQHRAQAMLEAGVRRTVIVTTD